MASKQPVSPIEKMRHTVFQAGNQNNTDKNLAVNGSQTDLDTLYANFLYNGSDTNKNYHNNAIKTADLVLKVAMVVFVIVTIYMCCIIGVLIGKKEFTVMQMLLPVITATVVDFLSATIIWIMKRWLESKNTYFEESIKGEELSKIIGLIRSMPEGDSKNHMIEKLVDNFCVKQQNRNTKNTPKKNSKTA